MKANTITHVYRLAAQSKLVSVPDSNAIRRAQRAYRKNLENPGDCADLPKVLIGLAIAQADIGVRPGWIPQVQSVGCKIADLL